MSEPKHNCFEDPDCITFAFDSAEVQRMAKQIAQRMDPFVKEFITSPRQAAKYVCALEGYANRVAAAIVHLDSKTGKRRGREQAD